MSVIKKIGITLAALLFVLSIVTCEEMFGEFNNKADPESTDYQGTENKPITSLTLSASTISLYYSEQRTLSASRTPSDAVYKTLTWSSSNTAVATVSSSGLVTCTGRGICTITVTSDNGVSASCAVYGLWRSVTGVSLSSGVLSIRLQKTAQLTASVLPTNASNMNVTWSSSDSTVASVSSAGLIIGLKVGTAVITAGSADDSTKKATCTVTVVPGGYITFNKNGGTGTMASQMIAEGASAALSANAFTRSGYVFLGWSTSSSAAAAAYTNQASFIMGAADVTLYAVWGHTISYDANGGTGVMAATDGAENSTVTLRFNTFTRTGYTFAGWASSSYSSAVLYADAASVTIGSANTTLYAKWTLNTYSITYQLSGGLNSTLNPSTYTYQSSTITLSDPVRTGYTFDGWYTSSAYSTRVTQISPSSIGNKVFYAKWILNSLTIDPEMDDPIDISFSWSRPVILTGGSVTLTAMTSTDVDQYIWYLDNNLLSGKTTAACTLPSGMSAGSHTISLIVRAGDVYSSDEQTFTVIEGSPVTGLTLNTSSATIGTGRTKQLTATVLPSNAYNTAVTWTSSNTSVATVSSTGLVTGLTAGTATITATTADGGYTAMCTMTVTSSLVTMVNVTGGTFNNGTANMTVSSFYIGKYEVTQGQYASVMGSIPSSCSSTYGLGSNYPVYYVTWYDSVAFCNALSALEGFNNVYTISGTTVTADYTKNGYRLPTEAEWQFAARGGSSSNGYTYSGSNTIGNVAWYTSNAGSKTHTVGGLAANELGIYDMSGNVWEWCGDWYGAYPSSAKTNYTGLSSGTYRVFRGGSWLNDASDCAVSSRDFSTPSFSHYGNGFRVVRSAQ